MNSWIYIFVGYESARDTELKGQSAEHATMLFSVLPVRNSLKKDLSRQQQEHLNNCYCELCSRKHKVRAREDRPLIMVDQMYIDHGECHWSGWGGGWDLE